MIVAKKSRSTFNTKNELKITPLKNIDLWYKTSTVGLFTVEFHQ